MSRIVDRMVELTRAINEAPVEAEYHRAQAYRRGWLEGIGEFRGVGTGWLLMDADAFYLSRGFTGDICGGVWITRDPVEAEAIAKREPCDGWWKDDFKWAPRALAEGEDRG